MRIKRNAKKYGLPDKIIEIELTGAEIEQAFRIREHEYQLEDVRNALQDAYESEQISDEDYRKAKNSTAFQEAVLKEYEKRFSCNVPENVTWEESWKAALKEIETGFEVTE